MYYNLEIGLNLGSWACFVVWSILNQVSHRGFGRVIFFLPRPHAPPVSCSHSRSRARVSLSLFLCILQQKHSSMGTDTDIVTHTQAHRPVGVCMNMGSSLQPSSCSSFASCPFLPANWSVCSKPCVGWILFSAIKNKIHPTLFSDRRSGEDRWSPRSSNQNYSNSSNQIYSSGPLVRALQHLVYVTPAGFVVFLAMLA